MNKILTLLVISYVLFPTSVFALISGSASTNSIGNVNYTFSDGTSGYSYKDSAGYTHYQFSNGVYGTAYTNTIGTTHYNFDQIGKQIYIDGRCLFPTAGSCTDESQYQEMLNNAIEGLPACQPTGPASGPEFCTPEGQEQLILSKDSNYGPWLKMCRESINIYTAARASYDKCVQEQNAKYEQIAQLQIDLLKRQLDLERVRLETQKLQSTTDTQQRSGYIRLFPDTGTTNSQELNTNDLKLKIKENTATMVDTALSNRLKGKLLLQVEQGGRIWYVDFEGKKYEVTFANALTLFQKLSTGIKNVDLNKIPLSNEKTTSTTGNRLKGKLLLQVEDKGRIWYVDFNGRRQEVTWANLMELFKKLSLGITNADLDKIENGSL